MEANGANGSSGGPKDLADEVRVRMAPYEVEVVKHLPYDKPRQWTRPLPQADVVVVLKDMLGHSDHITLESHAARQGIRVVTTQRKWGRMATALRNHGLLVRRPDAPVMGQRIEEKEYPPIPEVIEEEMPQEQADMVVSAELPAIEPELPAAPDPMLEQLKAYLAHHAAKVQARMPKGILVQILLDADTLTMEVASK